MSLRQLPQQPTGAHADEPLEELLQELLQELQDDAMDSMDNDSLRSSSPECSSACRVLHLQDCTRRSPSKNSDTCSSEAPPVCAEFAPSQQGRLAAPLGQTMVNSSMINSYSLTLQVCAQSQIE